MIVYYGILKYILYVGIDPAKNSKLFHTLLIDLTLSFNGGEFSNILNIF